MSSAPKLLLLTCLALAGCRSTERALVDVGFTAQRSAAGLGAREAVVDGRPVAYLERPGSGPTVVLLHGFGGDSDHWVYFTDTLADSFRVLAPDLAGHGGSARDTSEAYTPERLADEVRAWMDAVAPEAVHLVGNSLGGGVAVLITLRAPARVRSLALLAPAGVPAPEASPFDSLLASGENALIPTSREAFDRLYDLTFVVRPPLPSGALHVLADDAARRAPFLRGLFASMRDAHHALLPRLPDLARPVLLVWGERDRILDPSAAAAWAEALPDVRVVHLPETGHLPMIERPEETARLLEAFIASLPS